MLKNNRHITGAMFRFWKRHYLYVRFLTFWIVKKIQLALLYNLVQLFISTIPFNIVRKLQLALFYKLVEMRLEKG